MTKDELIEKLIKTRRRDTTERSMRLVCLDTDCTECPHMESSYCSADIIDDLLDHIIDNETPQETNLEHYWDNLYVYFSAHRNDGYLAFVDSKMKDMAKWLLAPYEETKPKYKLTQFEYDVLDSYDCLDNGMRFDGYYQLMAMKEKGYFKNVSEEANIFDIVNNAEVIEDD